MKIGGFPAPETKKVLVRFAIVPGDTIPIVVGQDPAGRDVIIEFELVHVPFWGKTAWVIVSEVHKPKEING